ncbi:transposase [Paraburkholderia aromaticivorans]|uniref:transposase n=1 Tax=Paraburkholderia aromaticivorans TaxID=2026199 RepID=UPI0038B84362
MIALPPTAITVAELPVEPNALQAFALEQNRLACVLWEQLEALQHQIAQANRARFGVSSERLAGQAELFDATTAYPFRPSPPRFRSQATPARDVRRCRWICRASALNMI